MTAKALLLTLALDIVLSGLVLGGMYALIALGLTLQYGIARIMNLSYGECLVAAAFAALYLYSQFGAKGVKPVTPAQAEKLGAMGKAYVSTGSHKPPGELGVFY